jgi:glycosyltransferase involved in cell wall biosynthesis
MSEYINGRLPLRPRILYLDMAYTLKMAKERELDQEFNSRDCGGYFEHVWGVHPIADIPEGRALDYDGFKVTQVEFSPNQTVIEGVSAYYSFLKKIFPLNFLISQIRFAAFLVSLVKREKISIVLSTDPHFSGLLGLIIKIFTPAKLVLWVVAHNDDIYKSTGKIANPRLFRYRWIEKTIEKIVFRNADLVAGGNQNNLEFALNNGAKLSKSTIFPVGKLIHRQHLLEPSQRDTDPIFETDPKAEYYFIYIGRLIEMKFVDDVIKSFGAIKKSVPNSALILAGDGPELEQLSQLAVELGIREDVYFLGNINQLRLANILSKCFAVLSPSTGRSLIEASLGALPIIAYDRDWQPEFIENNNAGFVVPFRDWQKMAERSIYLVQNPSTAREFGKGARNGGLKICDLEKLYGHEIAEFKKILN